MRSSCIAWPENEPLLLIRASQVQLCDGNHCAAALLSFFEYWHTHKLAHKSQAEYTNRVAQQFGDQGTQDTSLLQFHNEDDLEQGLLGLYERKMIRKGIDLLVSKGFLSTHKNPNQRYRFDHTRYFLFHPERVSAQLLDIADQTKTPDRVANEPCLCEDDLNSKSSQVIDILDEDFCPDPSNQKGASSGQKGGTRTEITDREENQEKSLTTFETLPGTGNAVSDPGITNGSDVGEPVVKGARQPKRKVQKLDEGDWLWEELQHYRDEFDIDCLNDTDWWNNVANSFPVFNRTWVPLAFASLAQWQQNNPQNRCRSERGWKRRMNYSLNFYYDKHMRRQSYGQAQKRY